MTVESAIRVALEESRTDMRFRDLVIRCLDLDGEAERSAQGFCAHLRATISTWLRRVPCTWSAAEALHYLRDAGCLPQWQRLVATCPGW